MPIEVNGKSFETDEEGYLADLSLWEKDLATAMAKEDDIDLTADHWDIINFLREYYEEYQIAPAVRVLTKAVGKNLEKTRVIVNTFMSYSHMDQESKLVSLLGYQNQLVAYNLYTEIRRDKVCHL